MSTKPRSDLEPCHTLKLKVDKYAKSNSRGLLDFGQSECCVMFPFPSICYLCHLFKLMITGFFSWGGTGGSPPSGKNFANPPPSDTCPRFWTKACPPPAKVRPRKFEKFKYIFVSNLTTFKLKSTLKSCISCLKQQKMA